MDEEIEIKNNSCYPIFVAGWRIGPDKTISLPLRWLNDSEPPHDLIKNGLVEVRMVSEESVAPNKEAPTFGRELDL